MGNRGRLEHLMGLRPHPVLPGRLRAPAAAWSAKVHLAPVRPRCTGRGRQQRPACPTSPASAADTKQTSARRQSSW
jgi:hypothetical protein